MHPDDVKDSEIPVVEHGITVLGNSIGTIIDHAQIMAKEIARGPGGREVALAITNLQQARHWVADALREIEHPLPEK